MRYRVLFLACCIFFCSYLGLQSFQAYIYHTQAQRLVSGALSFNELEEKFKTYARRHGGVEAYNLLRIAPLSPGTDMHLLGHAIGDILYTQEGISGIRYCTQEFRNACSHSIVIGALNDFGDAALDSIRDACKKAPGGTGAYTMCYHGLGHGIFAYYSYTLPQTVSLCKQTGTREYNQQEYIECVGGAVMELMGGGGHNPEDWEKARKRYLSTSNPTSICTGPELPEDVREICITYLTPFLWEQAGLDLGAPNPEMFPRAFQLCTSRDLSERLREACMGSFGKEFIAIVLNQDLRAIPRMTYEHFSEMITWCESAPEQRDTIACVSSVVRSLFWGGENDVRIAVGFCEAVRTDSIRRACFESLSRSIVTFAPNKSVHERWCASIPLSQRDSCHTVR